MSVTPKVLINAKFATSADEYTAPASTTTIIDKFTATNPSATTSYTLDIYIIPSGETAADSNKVVSAKSFAANETVDFSALQNQILKAGDIIRVVPSSTGVISIRCSGREVT